jgi:arsenate reductase
MQEAGVDIAQQRGKSVLPLAEERFDLVVTLCESAAVACPPIPRAARRVHRGFEDPSFLAVPGEEEDIEAYRALRDALRAFVEELLAMDSTRGGDAAS